MVLSTLYKIVCHVAISALWIIQYMAQGIEGHGHILELNILGVYLLFSVL